MEFLRRLLDTLWQLSPQTLNDFCHYVGVNKLYAVLWVIIFMETGLVVTPFLPGDTLLFAVGALSRQSGSVINLPVVAVLMIVAAVVGDAVNYSLGKRVGPKVFTRETSRVLNKKHLMRAHEFYEKHGGKTIILARFIPIIRTFAPFVAGIGQMTYPKFAMYNVTGGIAWVLSFLCAGYWFGGHQVVKRNFHLVIGAIIIISVMPIGIEYIRARRASKRKRSALEAAALGQKPEQ
jgi:membrane-associated protein